jgi:hypothetical protein
MVHLEGPPVSVGDLLGRLIAILDAARVPHMIAGSFASAFHGMPRSALNVDIVIDPTPVGFDALVASLPADQYYVDTDAAREALRRRSQLNLVDLATGWKVDLIVREERPFSISEFQRREPADLFGTSAFVATAEDTIIAKLEWASFSDSDRQLRDVWGILSVRAGAIDLLYMDRWIGGLGLTELWSRVSRGD